MLGLEAIFCLHSIKFASRVLFRVRLNVMMVVYGQVKRRKFRIGLCVSVRSADSILSPTMLIV